MTPETVRVLDGYLRQSQATRDDSVSLAQQREKIEGWAKLRGVTIGHWHEDRDTSGKTLERPGLEAAIERIKAGLTEGIVVSDLSRLSRANVGDALKLFSMIHDDHGGAVVVVDLGGEAVDPTTPTGEMIITVMLAMARLEWRMTAAKIADGKAHAARAGKWLNRPPVGYVVNGNGFLEPSGEADLVREIFQRVATDGLALTLGWLGRRKGEGADPSRRWTRAWLVRVVGHRVYLGEAPWNGISRADAHEPLTDLPTWTRCQRIVAGLETETRAPRARYPFSGVAVCADCGAPMRGSLAGGKGRKSAGTYRPGQRSYKSGCQHRTYAVADDLEAAVRALMLDLAREFGDPAEPYAASTSTAVTDAQRALETAQRRRDTDLADLDLPPDLLKARLAAHEAAIAAAEAVYSEAVAAARPEIARSTFEELRGASLVDLAAELGRWYDRGAEVRVRPGRDTIAERVAIKALEPSDA